LERSGKRKGLVRGGMETGDHNTGTFSHLSGKKWGEKKITLEKGKVKTRKKNDVANEKKKKKKVLKPY